MANINELVDERVSLSKGWLTDIQDAIENITSPMSGSAYGYGVQDGLKKALEIISNHI